MKKETAYTKYRILIVEDQKDMRRIIKTVFRHLGFENIDLAENGLEGLRLIKETFREEMAHSRYDLIVCDWVMPEMTGIQLLSAVREDNRSTETPFLMITSQASREEVVRAAELGVTDYIVKPISATVLEEKIRKIFSIPNPVM